MAVYVFELLVGYFPNGVDYAQAMRYRYLKMLSTSVKYIFTSIPDNRSVQYYQGIGIETEDMLSAHLLLSGNGGIGKEIQIREKAFQKQGGIVLRECYSDRLLYTEYYIDKVKDGSEVRLLFKRTFKRQDGTTAYDILYGENETESYLFPNGKIMSKEEFLCEFIRQLKLTETDIVLIDRPGNRAFVEPLFTYGNKAKIQIFFHSQHYAQPKEAWEYLFLNFEYFYWFRYSGYIHTIFTSTEEQALEVIDKLQEYRCDIPNVQALPISGIEKLCYPVVARKPYSLLTVSRINSRKRVDWIVRSVVEAHAVLPQITLDIYGTGLAVFTEELKQMINENHAEEYITMKGHCEMEGRYTQYEGYLTASMGETFGLSVLEAISSGNAVIGLDTKYGNPIFIKNEKNGYLIDYDFNKLDEEGYVEHIIHEMAQRIIDLFNDRERLDRFQEESYQIASGYMNEDIGKAWIRSMEDTLKEN